MEIQCYLCVVLGLTQKHVCGSNILDWNKVRKYQNVISHKSISIDKSAMRTKQRHGQTQVTNTHTEHSWKLK
jgi:hypothetical protein